MVTVALTSEQMQIVRAAASGLRLSARDKFNLDLASALARCPNPPSDTDIRAAIRQILGVPTSAFNAR
jgi:hypothetical protein